MTDIVERIRLRQSPPGKLANEAADEIERLRAEVKQWQTLASQGIDIERKLRTKEITGDLELKRENDEYYREWVADKKI